MRDIFTALELCSPKAKDYQIFKAIVRVAKSANVTPYNADKLFWLIGSGNFYSADKAPNSVWCFIGYPGNTIEKPPTPVGGVSLR